MNPTRRLGRDRRGASYIQYLALMLLLALPIAVATVNLGFPLLRFHRYTQLSLVAPLP